MSAPLPFAPNTTCDIYYNASPPPAPARVSGVALFLEERWENVKPGVTYTHVARCALGTDVRDTDLLFVPNGGTGTQFNVVFVTRRGRGTDLDHKVAYLNRQASPPWPTDNL